LCGCGDDRHFSIKQPLLLTPHLSPSPKQTQKEKENNTKKKIKEKKNNLCILCVRLSSSSSLLLRYHHLVPHRKPHHKTPRFVRTWRRSRRWGAQYVPTVHHLPSGSRPVLAGYPDGRVRTVGSCSGYRNPEPELSIRSGCRTGSENRFMLRTALEPRSFHLGTIF
jgi:hypothetical protein